MGIGLGLLFGAVAYFIAGTAIQCKGIDPNCFGIQLIIVAVALVVGLVINKK